MNKAQRVGISFGLTSATMTTLGLIIGLEVSTGSKMAVVAGVLTIAIADAFSDAFGVHLAKESEGNFDNQELRQVTVYTFIYKFIFALTFLIPILILEMPWSLYIAIIWAIIVLVALNYYIAKSNNKKPGPVILEHGLIAVIVILLSWGAGLLIAYLFN